VARVRKVEQKQGRFHHGNLRQALIDGALLILGKEGQGAITLREVARRAGVTHAAPYRHFDGKEALLAAVAEEGFHQLRQDMEASGAGPGDALDRLQRYGEAYLRFALKNPAHYRLMYGPEFAHRAAHSPLQEASRRAFMLLLGGVREGQEARLVRDGDPVHVALGMWSMVHGLSLLIMDRQMEDAGVGKSHNEAVIRLSMNTLRDGLSAKKANSR
jgi:AcrR family transcriptional regulator